MARLVQCVPNFSEGRRVEVLEAIVEAMRTASDVRVVDYSMDVDHNRSVVTLLGTPEEIRASAVAGAKKAVDMIDIRQHTGEHPRIGAVDVIPIVPVQQVTMAEAVTLSLQAGDDIARQLNLPVYFYERSASAEHRTNLASFRKRSFHLMQMVSLTGHMEPDLGPHSPHPTAGAVVVGARGPLIAFNVYLATDDMGIADQIAATIREVRASHEALPGVKAIAVYLKSRDIAQVSTNITRPDKVTMLDVFSFVEAEARARGIEVLESELIGAIRQSDLRDFTPAAIGLHGFTEARILDRWM